MSSALISPTARIVDDLLGTAEVQSAIRFFSSSADAITEEQISICSIPASPFGERARAEYLATRFLGIGLSKTEIDAEGNCIALRKGQNTSPLLVISAHLDTIFPPDTDFTVKRVDDKLLAPGISDDGCGLTAILALARACEESRIETKGSLLFVGTVGEEGEGNLRGVRYLLTQAPWANRIDAFVSLDGPGVDRITNGAVGSRRYRAALTGTGGHSWGDFGVANPVHALGRAVSKLASYPILTEPRTTFNVGRIAGGTSVNAIPRQAIMDVDLRSTSEEELLRLDAFFRRAVTEAVEIENAARRKGHQALELNLKLIGQRPGGETPANSQLVQFAQDATRVMGFVPRLDQASTDANLPISMGIPAVTLGAGGVSGSSHTLEEWYDPRGRELGLQRALLVMLGIVGLRMSDML
jgi:tripeptide aminopeptidase